MQYDASTASLSISDMTFLCGIREVPDPVFSACSFFHINSVLVRNIGFSCNFRDKILLSLTSTGIMGDGPWAIGSDFVGRVLEVGAAVTQFQLGDIVIPDCQYSGTLARGTRNGVPSNTASNQLAIMHEEHLMKIPGDFPLDVAAAFSIGAQTSYSMVRRANLTPGDRVLVTSARSNTSLFVINALQTRGVKVHAATTSPNVEHRLIGLGVDTVYRIKSPHWVATDQRVKADVATFSGFRCIIDPFADVYLPHVMRLVGFGGTYITCGLFGQGLNSLKGPAIPTDVYEGVLTNLILRNASIIGNCLGTTEDLAEALQDYHHGKSTMVLDTVYGERAFQHFLARSFASSTRFGKVVMKWE